MFTPCNRYLLVSRVEESDRGEILIALPEGSFSNENLGL